METFVFVENCLIYECGITNQCWVIPPPWLLVRFPSERLFLQHSAKTAFYLRFYNLSFGKDIPYRCSETRDWLGSFKLCHTKLFYSENYRTKIAEL
jgi:hypothetical protein